MLLRSVPHLDTPWRDLLLAAVAAMAIPATLGAVLLGTVHLFGAHLPVGAAQDLSAPAMLLAYSPALSLAGMMLAVPLASLLIRAGWFGWLPAALAGLAIGATLGEMADIGVAAPFGLCALLILRATLGRLRRMTA